MRTGARRTLKRARRTLTEALGEGRDAAAAWRARRARGGGRLESLGQDHDAGHRNYVAALDDWGRDWLRTKPFAAPPTDELARCLHSFAHIADAVPLPPGARVLDVGCGPGWMSEWLARCGHRVTGVDVSEDMLRVARARLAALDPELFPAARAADFTATRAAGITAEARFEAALLYDALHHLDDERSALSAIFRALAPGGSIYVHEGVRPPPGSPAERDLIEEMERYGTLESPFDPDYLRGIVADAGFVEIRRFIEYDRLVELDAGADERRRFRRRLRWPTTNTLIAIRPPDPGRPEFAGRLELRGATRVEAGVVRAAVRARNTGGRIWPVTPSDPTGPGSVTLGPHRRGGDGGRIELARVPLPHAVRPGEAVEVEVVVDAVGGPAVVDLVREGHLWFADAAGATASLTLGAGA